MDDRTVLKVRRYEAGYEVRTELIKGEPYECDDFTIQSAYTPEGLYIGGPRDAYRIVAKRGIKPELADPTHRVCSIGFCEREQKWYGWSHRAIFGFGIGDTVREGSLCASSGWPKDYLAEHPECDRSLPVGFTAKTLDDAKRMAIAFADAV